MAPGRVSSGQRQNTPLAPAQSLHTDRTTTPVRKDLPGTLAVATRQALFTQLDSMREDMEEADKSAMVEEKLLLGAAKGISLTLFAGTVKWYLKAGSLLASLLSSLPLWTPFDPLPVLSMSRQ